MHNMWPAYVPLKSILFGHPQIFIYLLDSASDDTNSVGRQPLGHTQNIAMRHKGTVSV